ncbi:EF-hand domain-containing protein [Membranihabitans marinus]|uniref:EF-hand domain-containing protein n=1 Tax=Membranihabitans marinus TaxID=1227546 RepID=UPI001F456D3E|nr:EF-hand domain-containing protein [Membranihabitans marinus]
MKNILFFLIAGLSIILTSCGSQKETTSNQSQAQRGNRQGPPSVEDIFKMDSNEDGKLSKEEVEGPLLEKFSTIDTNNDGYISKEELQNAPRPERRQGPPRG